MPDPVAPRPRTNWLWIAVIAVFAVVLLVWLLNPTPENDAVTATASEPAAADGFVTEPTGAAVPVTLPEATLSSPIGSPAPASTPAASPSASPTP